MCRIAAHVGAPVPLSSLLYDPPHGLESMAYRPRELQHGTVNVDGTGVAWWDDLDAPPLRYVTTATPWADPNLPGLAPRLRGRTVVAAVRGATPGIAHGAGNVAPFVGDGLAFAHNGWLGAFATGVRRTLEDGLDDEAHGMATAVSDSITLFQVLLTRLRVTGDLTDAVVATVAAAQAACAAHDAPATLNLVVSDGRRVVATRAHHGLRGNSLYTAVDADGTWLASEPMDDVRDWTAVPDDHVVELGADTVTRAPLPGPQETST